MYDIDYKNVKKGKSFFKILLVIGLVLLVAIGYLSVSSFIKRLTLSTSIEATAISENCRYDSENGEMCSPIYYYEVDGVQYQCRTDGSSSLDVNKSNNKVYYNPREPGECLTQYEANSSIIVYVALVLPIAVIVVSSMNISRINQRIKKIEYLAQYGTLYKGLRYNLESTGIIVNNKNILAPVVDFTLPSGSVIRLKGDARHDGMMADHDGLVDVLIDLNDPDNYYIDFEIGSK